MKNDYESIVRLVCGDNWSSSDISSDERDGGFGVAMILAYLRGTSARLQELSKVIGVPAYLLEMAYKRLQVNGLFSNRSWVLNDPLLRSESRGDMDGMYSSLRAWCYIAGMSSGFTGKGFTREEEDNIMHEENQE